VEKNELCPVCRDRVQADWLVCPNCRTRLHRVCPSCNRLADPEWPLCAYCGHEFPQAAPSPVSAARRVAERPSELTPEPTGFRSATNP
jgi:hypothetical protein